MSVQGYFDRNLTPEPIWWMLFKATNSFSERDKNQKFIQQALPALRAFADDSLLTTMCDTHHWLRDFYGTHLNSFETSLQRFNQDLNETAIVLDDYLKKLVGTRISASFTKHLTNAGLLQTVAEGCTPEAEGPNENITKIRECFEAALQEDENDVRGEWRQLRSRVVSFCQQTGCPETPEDPFQCIMNLRIFVSKRQSNTREALLLAEVERLKQQNEELKNENKSQSRIITNLTFRHLLEHLPGEILFKEFWRNSLKHACAGGSSHPLTPLLRRFKEDEIRKAGEGLYGRLSRNIHDFSRANYEVDLNQWDTQEGQILKSLKPIYFDTEGNVNWKAEFRRYD
jgi:hypothetical protein